MSLGSRPDPARGALDLPSFADGEDTLILPASGASDTPPSNSWWRNRRTVAIVAAALLLLAAIGVVATLLLTRPSGPTLQYQRARLGNLELSISAAGPVQSGIYNITFSGSAKIATIAVKVGDTVTQGQTVATLNATSLQDAVNQAQAAVSAAQTALNNAQANADQVAAQTQANLQAAYDQEQLAIAACSGATPTPGPSTFNPTPTPTPIFTATATPTSGNSACIQRAQDQYAAAQAQAAAQQATAQNQINTAQAQLNTANAQLQTAEDNLNNATLTAPHDGTVSQVNGAVGETPGAIFIQIVDLSSLQIAANVNEADIGVVEPGQPARFSVSAYGSRQFSGTVDAIAPVGQNVANVVTFPVTIDIDAASVGGAHLFPGMTATVTIITAERFQVVLVPVRAVTFAQAAATKTYGYITQTQAQQAIAQAQTLLTQLASSGTNISDDNPIAGYLLERAKGKWVVRPVVLGLTDGASYEVLAGVSSGDAIVVGAQR